MEQSFAVGLSMHWAKFYADSRMCQEAERSNLAKVFEPSQGYCGTMIPSHDIATELR
jgi:hypothetical protein